MAPKRSKQVAAPTVEKKAKKPADPETEKRKEAIAAARRSCVVFYPSVMTGNDLIERYAYMWRKETKAHTTPVVLPDNGKPDTGKYPFFTAYFYCGLVPPFSAFFTDLMLTYDFKLLDFTPNVVTTMSVFTHMCENFVEIVPNVALFRDYFYPRVEGDALSGSINWIPRANHKEVYPAGKLHRKWEEWPGDKLLSSMHKSGY